MQITHVVRGSEYLTSTPKYALLYDSFGWERPTYVHLPLLMGKNEDGTVSKLSKRHGSVSFQDLVASGYLPEAILNYIALLGWCPSGAVNEFYTLDELIAAFTLDGISKSPSVFDFDKLLWFNGEYIKSSPLRVFASLLPLISSRRSPQTSIAKKCSFFCSLDFPAFPMLRKKSDSCLHCPSTIPSFS